MVNSTIPSASEWFLSKYFIMKESKTLWTIFISIIVFKSYILGNISKKVILVPLFFDKYLTCDSPLAYLVTRRSRAAYLLRNLGLWVDKNDIRLAYFAFLCILMWHKKIIRMIIRSASNEACKPLLVIFIQNL